MAGAQVLWSLTTSEPEGLGGRPVVVHLQRTEVATGPEVALTLVADPVIGATFAVHGAVLTAEDAAELAWRVLDAHYGPSTRSPE